MTDISHFQHRRQQLLHRMGGGVAVIPTAAEAVRSRDSHYPYRFDSYFYYLTGFAEPESVLILLSGAQPKSILFCRDKNLEREIWDGFRHGPEGAREFFGVDEAYPISRLDELAPQLLANQARLYYALGADAAWDGRVSAWLNGLRGQARIGISAPAEVSDVRALLDDMRLIKSPEEISTMQRAATISCGAHRRAMLATRPGRMEYEIEAELLHEFRRHGAQSPAYHSIVAGGANACVLHYVFNNAQLRDGDLLLIDAGCEVDGYASDITRTFPVNGKFSGPQKDLYQLVLAAQVAAIAAIRSGAGWNAPHDAALGVLAQGLVDFGLCRGTPQAVLESGDYKRFYMHRTGHWLGLDVHDAGNYKHGDVWLSLEPGMALTVEPGCYVRPADDVPRHFWDIGIRIEDDVIVTAAGCDVITADAPKTVAEIESLMANG
ncbi:Xaa-Pro aminopeptidase [mine drainage metagenome]|uniref:Xaa-Pro aminopeptidase n=1 Tax=mine drainage metagenome TaxID=410659 RepID=A0A1J5QTA3_9ZZZZ